MRTFYPSSQQHGDYQSFDLDESRGRAHDAFQRRAEAPFITTVYFDELEQMLRTALEEEPGHPRLSCELAFTLLQNRPDVARLAEARDLVTTVERPMPTSPWLPTRLEELIMLMEANVVRNNRSYRPRRVNWAVNNECPMVCKGCYNPFAADQLTSSEALAVLGKLATSGVPAIMISGGDPILWPPLSTFLDAAARMGIEVGLDTTGYTLDATVARQLVGRVATVGIAVDGSTEQVHGSFRRSPNRDLLRRALDAIRTCHRLGAPHIRVHTVVHRMNLEDLPATAALLSGLSGVQQWSLFQWWGRRASGRIRAAMEVTDAEFDQAVAASAAVAEGIEVLPYRSGRRAFTNLFIQNNGQVVTFGEGPGEEFIVGHLREEMFEDVIMSPAVYQGGLVNALVGRGYEHDDFGLQEGNT